MAEQTTSSIVIKAEPTEIMAVIADFDAYPEWAQGVKSAEVVEGPLHSLFGVGRHRIDRGRVFPLRLVCRERRLDYLRRAVAIGAMFHVQPGAPRTPRSPPLGRR